MLIHKEINGYFMGNSMKNNIKYYIGAHMSVSGGFFNAIKDADSIGCTALQIFTKSCRQWKSKPIETQDAELFIQTQKKSHIQVVISHASYLINLGSTTEEVRTKAYNALVDEIIRCNMLEIPYLVLHPGTAEKSEKDATLKNIGSQINKALEETAPITTTILIETMAGQGKSVGSTFEELATILDQIKDKTRIGVCFDTCHAFAAGYDFTTKEGYNRTFQHFDDIIGLQYLKAFHINDSKKELNSHVDRHENIGQGCIPIQAFEMILNDIRFKFIPKILETPHEEDLKNDMKNLQTLLNLIQ